MAYKALYRTYRPSTFEEVAGQQHIVKTLKNALATGKIAHAYLFAGPRGTGKTTMAKLLAKALNCEHGIGCQCNECKNCNSINLGTHPDVLELDAASNNGVDDIRDLIDKVKYGTILGRYKVYIIDEVHMLSAGAFNALLKTLEEPPEHVIFVLATTEPHKILPTILSRCQRYDFSKVSENDIRERIKVVLEKEEISYNQDAVNLIISLADGGMRDALSILDQVLAYSGNGLNVQDILDIFSLESTEEKLYLLKNIASGNTSEVLQRLKRYIEKGTDIKRLTNDLLLILKDLLIYQSSQSYEFSEILKREEIDEVGNLFSNNVVTEMIDTLMATLKDFKNVTDINPLFEVTLLKLCAAQKQTTKPQENEFKPSRYERPISQGPSETKKQEIMKEAKKEEPLPPKEEIKNSEPIKEEIKEEEPISQIFDLTIDENIIYINGTVGDNKFEIDDDTIINIMVNGNKAIKNDMLENWKLLKRLMGHPSLGKAATLLIDGRPLVVSNKVLILECQKANMVEKLNAIDMQKDLQNVIKNTFNKKMFIYSVDRAEAVRLQQKFLNLRQLERLPKPNTIPIDFIGD